MINAKNCVLTTLLLFSFGGGAFAASSVSGLSQQELNKLGQSSAKDAGAYKGFNVKDDSLKQINPDYAKTDLVSTYNPMQAPTAAGSAKKWQCLSYSDAQISGFYKSQNMAEKQLALDCDTIRAAEKTNDKMDGKYGDPLENDLVRLFTERQNEQEKNKANGNVNIECSPLGGNGGAEKEEKCLVQMLPVEKTCNRQLTVKCYANDTGKYLDDFTNYCRIDAGIDAAKGSAAINASNQTVYLETNSGRTSFWVYNKEEAIAKIGNFMFLGVSGWNSGKRVYFNGREIFKGKGDSYFNENQYIINDLIVNGWNSLGADGNGSATVKGPFPVQKPNCEVICKEFWEEACVDGNQIGGEDEDTIGRSSGANADGIDFSNPMNAVANPSYNTIKTII